MHERWSTSRHLIEENAKSPPVHAEAMTLLFNDLRCKVLRGAAETESLIARCHELAESKISQVDVTILINEDIFWFEISVHNAVLMQIP